jgi:hypothetical protein
MTFCFRANGKPKESIPDWLSVEVSFEAKEPRCYGIWVVSWIAEPACALGTLDLNGSASSWIAHLESLGFEDIVQVSCKEFFSPRADRDR